MAYFEKVTASRPNIYQVVQLSSAVAVNSSAFASETYQIRVISNIAAWFVIGGGVGSTTPTAGVQTAGSGFIAANTASGDYFAVTPGQQISLISLSSATTGTVSVIEMT